MLIVYFEVAMLDVMLSEVTTGKAYWVSIKISQLQCRPNLQVPILYIT